MPVVNSVWTAENTSFMLECYHQYLEQIGPMKKFKNKRCMWMKIKQDIQDKFNYSFTDIQIENRYKTVLKRNKMSTKNNNTTGSSPKFSTVDNEFAKITALDDSIEPAVQVGTSSSGLKRLIKEDIVPKDMPIVSNKKVKTSVTDVLIAMLKEKEENKKQRELNRERRHNEKMDLLRTLLNNK
ncbi:uncharacterized protein LOC126554764 [Aphis gossypii]|uniref:uncharacterized protein LOC126554764 n=1 Tax=Aphis gossypii TaxID=80765 RepID=UPI0021593578|nr:uncharacterized protein LOC126554764 [Aphis gossypii]